MMIKLIYEESHVMVSVERLTTNQHIVEYSRIIPILSHADAVFYAYTIIYLEGDTHPLFSLYYFCFCELPGQAGSSHTCTGRSKPF